MCDRSYSSTPAADHGPAAPAPLWSLALTPANTPTPSVQPLLVRLHNKNEETRMPGTRLAPALLLGIAVAAAAGALEGGAARQMTPSSTSCSMCSTSPGGPACFVSLSRCFPHVRLVAGGFSAAAGVAPARQPPPSPTKRSRVRQAARTNDPPPFYSSLWGRSGELFNPAGRITDWGRAGYAGGAADIPYYQQAPAFNVWTHGALANGSGAQVEAGVGAVRMGWGGAASRSGAAGGAASSEAHICVWLARRARRLLGWRVSTP